jgi:hypothetical protein
MSTIADVPPTTLNVLIQVAAVKRSKRQASLSRSGDPLRDAPMPLRFQHRVRILGEIEIDLRAEGMA